MRRGKKTRSRVRKTIEGIANESGPSLFKRTFRMNEDTFEKLFKVIEEALETVLKPFKDNHRFVHNGVISQRLRLAMALRIFAGSCAEDVMLIFGVSKCEVHHSVDYVTDAILETSALDICFPTDHSEQLAVAERFKNKSDVGFDKCVGCVDGMLIWILKPSDKECKKAKVGSKTFYCARKHKFGLNMQGVCDADKRFTYISLSFPGSVSDFLAFENSSLRRKLGEEGYLHNRLCLFGDNAYVNRSYMATPYSQHSGIDITRDHYNFFHSQLRINIECAFGILVQRWGILRKPFHHQYSIQKICKIVECLVRIHNFLIDNNLQENLPTEHIDEDQLNLVVNGAIDLQVNTIRELNGVSVPLPEDLLHGGEHFDDDLDRSSRRQPINEVLPREVLLEQVSLLDMRRPARSRARTPG